MTQTPSYRKNEKSIWDEIGLATFKDGFAGGFLFAIALHFGVISIVTPLDQLLVFVLLILGIATTVNKLFSRGSFISSPWDGVISGFGVVFGALGILQTYILPYLTTTH
jgi:hypothetical protein